MRAEELRAMQPPVDLSAGTSPCRLPLHCLRNPSYVIISCIPYGP